MHTSIDEIRRSSFGSRVLGWWIALLLAAATLGAQQPQPGQSTNTGVPEIATPPGIETAEDEYGHVHVSRNQASLFLGGSRLDEGNGFGVGGRYEFRFHKLLGAGVEGEYVSADWRDVAVVFPVHFHPGAGLRVSAGPGFERGRKTLDAAAEKTTEFLWRFGVSYDVVTNQRLMLTPSLSVDFVNGRRVWTYGVSFGVGF